MKDLNNTKVFYQADKTLHELFEDQVQQNPNNIAVIFNNDDANRSVICIGKNKDLNNKPVTNLRSSSRASDLAYVIFTSGSTGKPKGVAIAHESAINTLLDINNKFQVCSTDQVLALSAISFDLSVYDIFGLLIVGGVIVIPSPLYAKEPIHWVELLQKGRITIWNTVPMLMQMLIDFIVNLKPDEKDKLKGMLRLVLLSGDWIPLNLPGLIKEIFGEIQVTIFLFF